MSRRASFGRADPDGELFLRPTRVRDELVARDEAVAHAHDAFGVRGDVRLVRDHHDGLAEVVEALKDRKDLRARSRVQVSRRLVREDHRRVVQERARDRDALLLTAGELARAVVDPVAEADLLERSERALAPLFAVAAVEERQLDVLDRVQSREQVVGLRDAPKFDDAPARRPVVTGPPPATPPPPTPGRAVAVARAAGSTARSPSATPLITSVVVSFEMPNTTSVSTASPSFSICR